MGKLDAQITDNHRLSVLLEEGTSMNTGLIPNGQAQLPAPYATVALAGTFMWTGQIAETWTIKPNLVNVLGLQYNRFALPEFPAPGADLLSASKAGLTGMPSGPPTDLMLTLAFNGPEPVSTWGPGNGNYTWVDISDMYTYQDNLQWTKGKHSFTFGVEYAAQHHNWGRSNYVPGISFSNNETSDVLASGAPDTANGHAYASYLLGLVDGANVSEQTILDTGMRYSQWAAYAQDDLKLTPKLTLNLGVRYNLDLPGFETKNRQSFLNPTLMNSAVGIDGALQFAGNGTDSCNCSTRVQTHKLYFDPRIGLAYSADPKTVIRGSFGISRFLGNDLGGADKVQGTGIEGYAATPNWSSPDTGKTPAFNWNKGVPSYTHPPFFDATLGTGFYTGATSTSSPTYDRPDTAARVPYTAIWNLTIERALSTSVVWQLSYTGNETHYLSTAAGLGTFSGALDPKYLALGGLLSQPATAANIAAAQALLPGTPGLPYPSFAGSITQMLRPFPQYNGINDAFANPGAANYHSMLTSVQKRMSNGLYLMASYVWSKSMGTSGQTLGWLSSSRNPYDQHLDYAINGTDSPNQIKAAWVYTLPAGKGHMIGGKNNLTNTLLGDWRISGNNTYTAGNPLGAIGGACNVPTMSCFADFAPNFTGKVRINGKYGIGNASQTQYINPAAFQDAKPYTFGNTPRNMAYGLRNPWYLDEDATVGKDFKFTERFNLRLQVDAFNLFNRTVFGGINTNIDATGVGGFGYISSQSNNPRQLQFETSVRF
jgi:hypothetical protein